MNCGTYLADCDRGKSNLDCIGQPLWVEGFISGITYAIGTPRRNISADSMKYALIKYCRENPLKDTLDGADAIYKELTK